MKTYAAIAATLLLNLNVPSTARAGGVIARRTTVCAALLINPRLMSVGRGIDPEAVDLPNDLPPSVSIGATPFWDPDEIEEYALATGGEDPVLKALEISRAFDGADAVAEYLETSRDLALELESEVDPRSAVETARYWTGWRAVKFGTSFLIPSMWVGLASTTAVMVSQDPHSVVMAPVAAALYGYLGYRLRGKFRAAYLSARAIFDHRARVRIVNQDGDRAGRFWEFEFLARCAAEDPAPCHLELTESMLIPESLAKVLIDTPRSDAHPKESENHRGLVLAALRSADAAPLLDYDPFEWRLVSQRLRVYTDSRGHSRLIVRIKMLKPAADAGPRRGGPRDADSSNIELGAALPAGA